MLVEHKFQKLNAKRVKENEKESALSTPQKLNVYAKSTSIKMEKKRN